MKFIKGFFSFFLTFIGFGLVIVGFSEFDFVAIGVGSVFLIPFLRKRLAGKKKKSVSNKSSSIKEEKPQKKGQSCKTWTS